MRKNLVFSLLMTVLLLATAMLMPSISFAKSVVLDVMLADEVAFTSSSTEAVQKIYAEYAPSVEYRKIVISVPAQSALSSTPLPAPVVRRIRERLKEQLQSILQPEDQIAYLILETHGSTSEKHESFLEMMGSFSSEGPDEEFREIFDPIRTRLASNASVIMSACEIFADGEAQASLRAQALLSYFGARDGVVYGSKFDEVDTLQTQGKYFSWKSPYVREKVQRAAFFNSGFTVVMATIAAIAGAHPLTALTVSTVTSALTAAMQYSWIRHADSEISEYARLNRGYLLQFKDGQMRSIEFIHKMKDLAKSFGIKRACSMIY